MSWKTQLTFINDLLGNKIKHIPEDSALDSIIYGIDCFIIQKGKKNKGILALSDKIPDHLCFFNQVQNEIKIIQLKNITNISFIQNDDNKITNEENFIQININQKSYNFSFENENKMYLFLKGLIALYNKDNLMGDRRKGVDNYKEDIINTLFNKNNDNFDNLLDEKEFKNFATEIGMDAKELLLYIDEEKDGIITKEEIMKYFHSITSGSEFDNIFKKYATIKTNNNKSQEYSINPEELKKFFKDIQKEPISDLEAYLLVIKFKSFLNKETKRKISKKIQNIFFYNKYQININKINEIIDKINNTEIRNTNILEENKIDLKLELNIKEFSNMLNSNFLSIYDHKKQQKEVITSHSLVDYFINSSHNTYLKGHQLKGSSDSNMYSLAVLKGFRLVELDCYNGKDDEIIITHGYTLVTKLKLEDVLIQLKENSFKNNPFPVILSIENHLDRKHQQILAQNLQKYLVDLYIFPYDSPPKTIPTLEELKYKFIVKCGGKRLYENYNIPLKIEISNILKGVKENEGNNKMRKYILEDNFTDITDSEEDEETGNIDEFENNHEIFVDRKRLLEKKSTKNNENFSDNEIIKKSLNNENLDNKEINFDKKENVEEQNSILEIKEEENNNGYNIYINNKKEETSDNNNIIDTKKKYYENKKIESNNIEEIEIEENENENEYIPNLENIRGFLGQKFKYELIDTFNYKHWEFVTLKSTLYLNLFKNSEKRKKIIQLSFHCMMKAYPQKFNSDNYDIIRCWCCGCQTAAINIQALEDDYTLFNQVFFTQNNNCGYVLKPKKLLSDSFYFEKYKNPKFFLNIEIISIFNFIKLAEVANISLPKNKKIQMKIYTLGPYTENDEICQRIYNNEYIFDLIGGFLTPSILNNKKVKFPVYEEDLGGIMIKFFAEKFLIGRACIPFCIMKNGYRKIPIFDNNSIIRESTFVVGLFEKSFL